MHILIHTVMLFCLLFIACDTPKATSKNTESRSAVLKKIHANNFKTDPLKAKSIKEALATYPSAQDRVSFDDATWKKKLSAKEYNILRKKGTEPAFSGALLQNKETGIYTCSGCGAPLFSSENKFKSGTGWPSFYKTIETHRVKEVRDTTLGMTRVEIICARCGGHLGHVFSDGPQPTGLRYCVNSVALKFKPLNKSTTTTAP